MKRSKKAATPRPSVGAGDGEWTTVIRPRSGMFQLNLRELLRYRDLIALFAKRDIQTVYRQTVLGPLWFVIQPLFTTVIYTFVFGRLANIGTDGIPYTLFYYGGTMLWNYFSAQLTSSMDTFTHNAPLFGKVYFPRMTVPISKMLSNLVAALIQFATLMCFYAYYLIVKAPIRPSWAALCFPLILVQLAMLSTGVGIIISSLTTKYRDLRHLMNFGVNLWMYATPVIYPLSTVKGSLRTLMYVNPVTAPMELFRYAFYGSGEHDPIAIAASAAVTLFIFFAGIAIFNRNERMFVDVI
jgi:lipopolysaccharide transport system permease protein